MEAEATHRDEAPSRLLERMRMRLLDLSARNPLLNYTHPRGSSLRIVDEIPTVVLDALIANRTYRFAALKGADDVSASVAEPEARAFVRSARNGRSGATAAVGSTRTHPRPFNQTSAQACASERRTTQ